MNSFRALLVCTALLSAAGRPPEIAFEKAQLDLGANETCAIADIDGDGKPDIVSGENWFENPGTVRGAWTKHRFRELPFSNNYVDAFSDLILDVDGDGDNDVITASWFNRRLVWHRNPGKTNGGLWPEMVTIEEGHPIEFAFLVDLDNDGKANEILPQFGSDKAPLAWYALQDGKFTKHVASPRSYGHGIGVGDVNKDGRNDILTPAGWLEAPADPRASDWKLHEGFPKGTQLGFMYVVDVNGDGRNDVLTSHAHDYGIFWFEQGSDGTWTKRVVDDSWSQAHALTYTDLNGDGKRDIITGKRYMAHNGRDPGEREPLGLYWYEQMPTEGKKFEWVRHVIDYGTRTGAGMQIPVADLDGDGDLDFAVGGKSGVFVFENMTKTPQRRMLRPASR